MATAGRHNELPSDGMSRDTYRNSSQEKRHVTYGDDIHRAAHYHIWRCLNMEQSALGHYEESQLASDVYRCRLRSVPVVLEGAMRGPLQ